MSRQPSAPLPSNGISSNYYNWNEQRATTATDGAAKLPEQSRLPPYLPSAAPYPPPPLSAGQTGPHTTVTVTQTPAPAPAPRMYLGCCTYRQYLIFRLVLSVLVLAATITAAVLGTRCYTCNYHYHLD